MSTSNRRQMRRKEDLRCSRKSDCSNSNPKFLAGKIWKNTSQSLYKQEKDALSPLRRKKWGKRPKDLAIWWEESGKELPQRSTNWISVINYGLKSQLRVKNMGFQDSITPQYSTKINSLSSRVRPSTTIISVLGPF